MTTSLVYDYTVTASDIITSAAEDLQIVRNGETLETADTTTLLRTLNLMTKELMGKPGLAPGLKRWTRNYVYMFLRKNKNVYVFGQTAQTTDNAALNAYSSAVTNAAANASQAVITIASTAGILSWPTGVAGGGIANTDIIGVQLSTGDFQWTTVSSGGGTTSLTLATNLTASVLSGAQIFAYPAVNAVNLPLDLLSVARRDVNGIDYGMDHYHEIIEYEAETNKNITATPIKWFYEKKRVTGNLYLNCFPSTLTDVLRAVALYPIDDESVVGNDMAFPQQWYGFLEWGLAKRSAPKFGKAWTDTMEQNYNEAMAAASAVDPEVVPQFFQPNREDIGGNYGGA